MPEFVIKNQKRNEKTVCLHQPRTRQRAGTPADLREFADANMRARLLSSANTQIPDTPAVGAIGTRFHRWRLCPRSPPGDSQGEFFRSYPKRSGFTEC
jgi:hypothetical protein